MITPAIVSYSDSSSEDDEAVKERTDSCGRKRKMVGNSEEETFIKSRLKDSSSDEPMQTRKLMKEKLPLPGVIQAMFSDKSEIRDNPAEHGGRIRSFPHVEGNWASYIYIPVDPDGRMKTFMESLELCLSPFKFVGMTDDLHISLSRTVCIRHHWIEPLVKSLKEQFQDLQSCVCKVKKFELYTNDEKTRTFASLEISPEGTRLMEYIKAADVCLQEYKLPTYYENPSFHVSLFWCVGDMIPHIPTRTSIQIQNMARDFFDEHPEWNLIPVDKVCLKTGFKKFIFHLQS